MTYVLPFVAFRVDFRWARGADAYLREVSDAYAEAFEADW